MNLKYEFAKEYSMLQKIVSILVISSTKMTVMFSAPTVGLLLDPGPGVQGVASMVSVV